MFLRVLERIHGHVGWLTVVALLHPAILLRNRQRRARLSVALTTSLVVVTALLGGFIYPEYRMRLKQRIFIESPSWGWMFERKEHLAVAAVTFACVGCVAHFITPSMPEDARAHVARTAHVAFVLAFVFALVVACIGVGVAAFKSF